MAQVAAPGYGTVQARQSSFDKPHSVNQEEEVEEEVVIIRCAAAPSLRVLQLPLSLHASRE